MEPHPVKSAVEGLKRYGKENYDVIFEGTSGRHRQEAQHSLEKCGNLLKQQKMGGHSSSTESTT